MKPELDKQRFRMAEVLANIIQREIPLVYTDESSLNTFSTVKVKSWQNRVNPNYHHRDSIRFSITIYGAIGNCLENGLVYMLGTSTN